MPFTVRINDQTSIQVLGTHFNVNAYADEPSIRTTLLEGRVSVTKAGNKKILEPGEQAIIRNNVEVKKVNAALSIAWKNGVFNFEDAPFDEFMRQLARWYDLEIQYKSQIPKKVFAGELGRNLALSQILEVLSMYQVRYQLKGRTLIIE
jgi:ferric-dicitrate binding protein FerR (iron transport regulator)